VPTLALAHPLGHGGHLRRRHPACQAPMHFLAISSGIRGGARPAVRHGAVAEGHQKVSHSIPTAPNSYSRVQLKAPHGPGHTAGCTQPPWRRRGACFPAAARPLPPRSHCAGRESPHLPERAQIDMEGGGAWEACLVPTLALAHPLGHGGHLRRRHPACQAPMHFLAISSGIRGGARPAVRHGAAAEGHQKVSHSIPTAPNSYSRVQLKAPHGPGHTAGCTQPPWRRRGACFPAAARPLPPRSHCAGRESRPGPYLAALQKGDI
jgi:hypothetical protein